MAEQTPKDVLCDFTAKYLNAQAYDLAQLKAVFADPENDAIAEKFATGLSDTLAGEGIDIDRWEGLTETEFEDGDAWLDHLEAVFAYLFEDGSYLYGDEPAVE